MRILGCWAGKSILVQYLCCLDFNHLNHSFLKAHRLIMRDKVYTMLWNIPQMVSLLPIFGNLEKRLGWMQRRRFDDLDVVKQKSNTRGEKWWFWINLMQGEVLPPLLSTFPHFNESIKEFSFTGAFCQLLPSIAFPFSQTEILTQYEDKEEDAWDKRCQEQPKEFLF